MGLQNIYRPYLLFQWRFFPTPIDSKARLVLFGAFGALCRVDLGYDGSAKSPASTSAAQLPLLHGLPALLQHFLEGLLHLLSATVRQTVAVQKRSHRAWRAKASNAGISKQLPAAPHEHNERKHQAWEAQTNPSVTASGRHQRRKLHPRSSAPARAPWSSNGSNMFKLLGQRWEAVVKEW